MRVNNVNGTSDNTCKCESWLEHWSKFGGGILPPSCREKVCTTNLEFGTRVQKDSFKDKGWYIVPLCKDHNGQTGKSLGHHGRQHARIGRCQPDLRQEAVLIAGYCDG